MAGAGPGEAQRGRRTRERGLAAAARELSAATRREEGRQRLQRRRRRVGVGRRRSQSPRCIIFSDTWWVIKFIEICDVPENVIKIFVPRLALTHN